jgi:uncharacterized protein (DUF2141 family)
MRKTILAALLMGMTCPAGTALAADLTITITGAGAKGEVRGMVFRDADSFDHHTNPVAKFSQLSDHGRVVAAIPDLPAGRYAIALYQDSNGNNALDKTLFGLPTEPYGFSNDASGVMGPPSFDQAAFDVVANEHHALTILLR